jgi:hypothetical protein
MRKHIGYRKIGYIGLILAFFLVSLLGLGPAMFADGSSKERVFTVSIVLVLYAIIAVCFEFLRRHNKKVR